MIEVEKRPVLPRSFDGGLLVLRGAAALVLVTWGWGKLSGLMHVLNTSQPLASWHFAQIIGQVGFPFPRFMTVCAVLNESLLMAMLVIGIGTRPAALIAALGMVGAFYASVCWHNELLRAALCVLIFAALACLGAGGYSLSGVLWPHRARPAEWLNDFGLLLLRVGAAIAAVALAIIPSAKEPNLLAFASSANWLLIIACLGGTLVGFGFQTRAVSGLLAVFWVATLSAGLLAGQTWNVYPIRAALFAIIYGTLALTGPGRISVTNASTR